MIQRYAIDGRAVPVMSTNEGEYILVDDLMKYIRREHSYAEPDGYDGNQSYWKDYGRQAALKDLVEDCLGEKI